MIEQGNYSEEEYYKNTLNALFNLFGRWAYVTAARWSYLSEGDNLLLFSPGAVGEIPPKQESLLIREFNKTELKAALSEFSFTKLLVDNDREIWFHFTRLDPEDVEPDDAQGNVGKQVYLRPVETPLKSYKILTVSAERASYSLVDEIIEEFSETDPLRETLYNKEPLKKKRDAIKNTLEVAIFSVFQNPDLGIKHIYFLPVSVPAGGKPIAGIFSISTSRRIHAVDHLVPILQPFAQGIMAPFQFREVEEQRRMFSLRSAIAAIMSRNMSHNIGSHVLWHVSQEIKPKLLV